MTQEQLEQLAAELGTPVVREVDPDRVARAVLARLTAEPVAARAPQLLRRGVLATLALAAALLLVLRFALLRPIAPEGAGQAAAGVASVLHELDDLTVSELEVLLESMPPLAAEAEHPGPASLDEMDAKNLERLLRSLEG